MHKLLVPFLFSLVSASTMAVDINEPFDFNYSVDGRNNRPITVFNDGETTFVQGRDKQQLFFNSQNVSMRGPYYVIKGIPETIEGYASGDAFRIVWQGVKKTAILDESSRINGDLKERSFSGTFGRLSYINGVPPDVGLVNPLPKNLQLREAMKALAPHGWSGAADRSINTTQTISIESAAGDSWVTVLDRLMTTMNIWVEVDSGRKNLYLRDSPPKGFAVVFESHSQERVPGTVANGEIPRSVDFALLAQPAPQQASITPSLLSTVNVRSIETKNGKTMLSLTDSGRKMRFINLENGESLQTQKESPVDIALPLVALFRIQLDTGEAVDVKRIFRRTANFNKLNPLGLREVTETDGVTVFTFAKQLPKMDFAGSDLANAAGSWSKNQFTVSGASPEWRITTPQSAVLVEMEDKGVFVWRKAPDPEHDLKQASN